MFRYRLSKLLAALGAVASLSIATPASAVPTVTFTETGPGDAVTLTVSGGVDVLASVVAPETGFMHGVLHIPFGDGVIGAAAPFPPITFVLVDSAGGPVSDIMTLTTPAGFGGDFGGPDWEQQIDVSFQSDSGLGLVMPPNPTCVLVETGLVQTCSLFSQTGAHILDLQMQSTTAEVPEPVSLALLGLGLAALGFSRRKKVA